MLSTTKKILLGAAIILPIAGYSYYKYAENNLTFKIVGGSIGSVSNGVATANFTFLITNTTGVSFNILALNLNAYINSAFVGIIQQSSVVIVPANGSAQIQVTTTLSIATVESSLLSDFMSLITGGGITAYLAGYCTAQINVPFFSFFNINIPVAQNIPLIGG